MPITPLLIAIAGIALLVGETVISAWKLRPARTAGLTRVDLVATLVRSLAAILIVLVLFAFPAWAVPAWAIALAAFGYTVYRAIMLWPGASAAEAAAPDAERTGERPAEGRWGGDQRARSWRKAPIGSGIVALLAVAMWAAPLAVR